MSVRHMPSISVTCKMEWKIGAHGVFLLLEALRFLVTLGMPLTVLGFYLEVKM